VEPRFAGASLEEIYDDPISTGALVANHMVRMLSLTADEMTDGVLTPMVVDDDRLAMAQRNLGDRIDVLGLQDRFEDFCAELGAAFGWDLGEPVFMNRTAPVPEPDGLRERILADNDHDVRLHRFARGLLSRR
jgi:hypothetical protein